MGEIVQVPSIVLKVFRFLLTSILSFLHVRQSRVENRHDLQSLTRQWLMHGNFCIILKSHFFISDLIDVDECKGNHSCHENANCANTIGSHVCNCQPGYTGNGQNCTGEF